MPELPDILVYSERLEPRIVGQTLEEVPIASPFVVRTYDPPIWEAQRKKVHGLRRIGKRIVIGVDEELFLVFHLTIAGRFQWKARRAKDPGRVGLAALDFPSGTLLFTEAGTRKRCSQSGRAVGWRPARPSAADAPHATRGPGCRARRGQGACAHRSRSAAGRRRAHAIVPVRRAGPLSPTTPAVA